MGEERVVFAPSLPLPAHLARHALADLFLDTFPYNAHTTANDALFAGLPLLTCAGKTFASRVAGSQLRSIGLPELVTDSLPAYQALALKLAREPARLSEYRERLARNRATAPLFDVVGYTRSLEELFLKAWEEHRAGTAAGCGKITGSAPRQPARRPPPTRSKAACPRSSPSRQLPQANSPVSASCRAAAAKSPTSTGTATPLRGASSRANACSTPPAGRATAPRSWGRSRRARWASTSTWRPSITPRRPTAKGRGCASCPPPVPACPFPALRSTSSSRSKRSSTCPRRNSRKCSPSSRACSRRMACSSFPRPTGASTATRAAM